MAGWRPPDPLRYEAPRPQRPIAPSGTTSLSISSIDEGLELDLLRRSYTNLKQECTELEELVRHLRDSVAPFTDRDLVHLERAIISLRDGLRLMRHAVKHERHWSTTGTLGEE